MDKTSSILTLAVIAAMTVLQAAAVAQRRYQFPSNCTCNYGGHSGCSAIDPSYYPDYEDMGFNGECLPPVPANHRLCYRTFINDCTDNDGFGYYGCRLISGGASLGFSLQRLNPSGDNRSSVYFDSLDRTETTTVCFYNVSVSNSDSTGNCSSLRLEHKANHPPSKYVSRISQSDTNNSSTNSTQCKSYVKIFYYDSEGGQQYETLCGEELATLDKTLSHATSLFLVYWTNNDRENNKNSSFHMRAQCIE